MPAVSVIIPVYKVEDYIERCARHLFEQTLEDIEYVFVDDCTPDSSICILERVLADYPSRSGSVTILHNSVNCGLPFSRRKGFEASTGDYIIHCDSDDWPENDMYAKLYAKASCENLDMVLCHRRVWSGGESVVGDDKLGAADVTAALLRQQIFNHVTNKLVSRRAYDKGVVWPDKNMCEDSALIIQLACNCDSFGFVFEPLYNYVYRREGSLSKDEDTVSKLEQMRENFNLAICGIEKRGLALKYSREIADLKCYLKLVARNLPRSYYLNVYPEVNFSFLFNDHWSVKERLGHLSKLMGLREIIYRFKHRAK